MEPGITPSKPTRMHARSAGTQTLLAKGYRTLVTLLNNGSNTPHIKRRHASPISIYAAKIIRFQKAAPSPVIFKMHAHDITEAHKPDALVFR